MVAICFYFQIHQPYRLRRYTAFDIGENHNYFDDYANTQIMQKVSQKSYLPTLKLLLHLIKSHQYKFKVSFSISGTALEQFRDYQPEVIEILKELASTNCVEFISETYYHSLSYIYSKDEFIAQIEEHKKMMKSVLGIKKFSTFRNTELIYNNALAQDIEKLGYSVILAEGADKILGWRNANFVYRPQGCESLRLLTKNYRLSDDIAFRFSNKEWPEWPLTAEKFCEWANNIHGNGEVLNLFMDFETFGEHQWEDTGIFHFLEALPKQWLENPKNSFITPKETLKFHVHDVIDVPEFISWADLERDLTAWVGNDIQNDAIAKLYSYEAAIKAKSKKNPKLLQDWKRLTTSDHFYYMCIKWFSDGDVHKYFSPYESPYDAYIYFMNSLADIVQLLKHEGART
jgi:alpha-amylase